MTFYILEKSSRRSLVMMARSTTSYTAGHEMQGMEVLCETDSPQIVPWLLKDVETLRLPFFARRLLEAAALAGEGEAILSKNVPFALYTTSGEPVVPVRVLWDALKATINGYPLASSWEWSGQDILAAKSIETAFSAFLAAREGRA